MTGGAKREAESLNDSSKNHDDDALKKKKKVEENIIVVTTMSNTNENKIDEDLHSRQLAVYGRESFRKLVGAKVLISGLNGLGAEVAKNVILAGVKRVTLSDDCDATMSDLASQFYLTEEDCGKNRAESCAAKLQELNPAVEVVTVMTKDVTEDVLLAHDVVVVCDSSLHSQQDCEKWDEILRKEKGKAFIKGDTKGVFGSVFCDFGDSFTVVDQDGEEPKTCIIASISNEHPALVTCTDDERVELEEGDLVTFSEVKGMNELNSIKEGVKIKSVKKHGFELDIDASKFSQYVGGGIATQVKLPKEMKFKSFADSLKEPGEFLLSDFAKMERSPQVHLMFLTLEADRKSVV